MTDRAIIVADTAGIIRYWSAGAEALFGHAAAAAIGQSLDLVVPEAYRGRHWAGFRAAMASGKVEPDNVASIPVHKRDGAVERFAGRLLVLTDAWGAATGAVAIFAPLKSDAGAAALYEL
jgi:PAS domain S-box-containing protein